MSTPVKFFVRTAPTRQDLALSHVSRMDKQPLPVTFKTYFFGASDFDTVAHITKMDPEDDSGQSWNIEGVIHDPKTKFNGCTFTGWIVTENGRIDGGQFLLITPPW